MPNGEDPVASIPVVPKNSSGTPTPEGTQATIISSLHLTGIHSTGSWQQIQRIKRLMSLMSLHISVGWSQVASHLQVSEVKAVMPMK